MSGQGSFVPTDGIAQLVNSPAWICAPKTFSVFEILLSRRIWTHFNKMSSLCCAVAAPGLAIPSHFFALPFHCRASQRFAFASRLNSMPSPSPAAPCRALPRPASPCLCFALRCKGFAKRRVAMPPRIRAVNAMPLRSVLRLISDVGKAALSAVAPLADAAQDAIIQPLTHNLFVAVVKEDYVKLAGATRRDLLTYCQTGFPFPGNSTGTTG